VIWEGLFDIVVTIIAALLSALPDYTADTLTGAGALGTIASGVRAVRHWMNLPALFGVLALWVTIEVAVGISTAAQWVYAKIPFKAT
jgi:hypothetical protein